MSRRALTISLLLSVACASRPSTPPRAQPAAPPPPVAAQAPPPPVAAGPPAAVAQPSPEAPRAEEDAHELVPDNPYAAELAARPPMPASPTGRAFRGYDVDSLLREMSTRPVQRVIERFSSSTMVFHMVLEGGLEIAFKPSIRGEGAWWRHEVVGYRLSRLLGVDARVPPAISRRVPLRAFGDFARGANLVVRGGQVAGAAIFWMPVLRRSGLTEPESRAQWSQWMSARYPVPPEHARRASQIAGLIAFDYLQANFDRWNSANVREDEHGDLVYRDNNRAWFLENLERLDRGGIAHIERVPASMLPRIEAATGAALLREARRDPMFTSHYLTAAEARWYDARRRALLERLREVIAREGEAAALLPD
ncbi:MAG: hypothetical protein R3A48_22720 [Polyangiales bacterium]